MDPFTEIPTLTCGPATNRARATPWAQLIDGDRDNARASSSARTNDDSSINDFQESFFSASCGY